jgi:hypothetical protein
MTHMHAFYTPLNFFKWEMEHNILVQVSKNLQFWRPLETRKFKNGNIPFLIQISFLKNQNIWLLQVLYNSNIHFAMSSSYQVIL